MPLLLLCATALAATQRFALVAGANDGGPDRPVLRYAVSDAEEMAGVLTELGGVAPEDALVLVQPERSDLEAGWQALTDRVQEAAARGYRTEVLVYYSGHSNERGLLLRDELYPYDELRAALEAVPGDVRVLMLDSCASGAMVRAKGGRALPPFLVDESVAVSGIAVLTSSAADEVAQEADPVGGSYFTHYLVSGLRGGADTVPDSRVTLNEAYQFAYRETLARTERTVGGAQHAAYDIRLAGSGDLVMTDLSATSAALEIGAGVAGRVFVRDADGDLVVELGKAGDRGVTLALPPGAYRVRVEQAPVHYEASVVLARGATARLVPADLRRVEAEHARARGDVPDQRVPLSVGVLPLDGLRRDDQGPRRVRIVDLNLIGSVVDAVHGVQIGVAFAAARDEVRGVQAAAGASVAERTSGVQTAAGAAVATAEARGVQATAGFALAPELRGVQAGAVAAAGGVHGLQLASGVTIAREVRGAQVGVVNVGGRVEGAQIGVVNVAKDADLALGLINVNLSGYNHLYVAASPAFPVSAGLTYGGKRLYTRLEYGNTLSACCGLHRVALGLGVHSALSSRLYLDVDVDVGALQPTLVGGAQPALLSGGRAVLGLAPARRFAVFAGPTLHYLVMEGDAAPVLMGAARSEDAFLFGATAGLRF